MQPFIQIDFLLKPNTAPTGMPKPGRDNGLHPAVLHCSAQPVAFVVDILQNSPPLELKPTLTPLPTPTTHIPSAPPTNTLPALIYLLLPAHLLLLLLHEPPTLALTGSDLALSGRRLPGSKLRRSLYGGSPTVAQCLPPANLQIA